MDIYRKGSESLAAWLEKSPSEINGRYKKIESELKSEGVPAPLARRMAIMPALGAALHLTRLAAGPGRNMNMVAEVYFGLDQRLGLDWLASHAHALIARTPWQRATYSVS